MKMVVPDHTGGLQGSACLSLAANGMCNLRAGAMPVPEQPNTSLGLSEELCKPGESVVVISDYFIHSLPGPDTVQEKRNEVL